LVSPAEQETFKIVFSFLLTYWWVWIIIFAIIIIIAFIFDWIIHRILKWINRRRKIKEIPYLLTTISKNGMSHTTGHFKTKEEKEIIAEERRK